MNNGDDTAYYLHQGFRVVAVEANPVLCGSGRERFRAEIERGQLTILTLGIAESEGSSTFWVCDSLSEWSSFEHRIASRGGSGCHSVEVQTIPFRKLLGQFGVPEYLKIDIEGADALCIRDLPRDQLPHYISCEDWRDVSERGSRMLLLLYETGYRRFKLLEQTEFEALLPPAEAFLRRCLRSAAYRFRPIGLAALPSRQATRYNSRKRNNYHFKLGSSGPWGEAYRVNG